MTEFDLGSLKVVNLGQRSVIENVGTIGEILNSVLNEEKFNQEQIHQEQN